MRGWKAVDALVEKWAGVTGQQCRLLVGMQRLPQDDLRKAYSLLPREDQISNQGVIRLKRGLAEEFRACLTIGAPTDDVHFSSLPGKLFYSTQIPVCIWFLGSSKAPPPIKLILSLR